MSDPCISFMQPDISLDFSSRMHPQNKFHSQLNDFQNWVESWVCGFKMPLFRLNGDNSVHNYKKK